MAHEAGNLETIHPRHFDIQQDDVRFVILQLCDRVQAVFGSDDFHAVALQQS